MYYAFTTLSTLGLGDMVPKSDTERILMSAIMFMGVMILAYIIDVFISI